MVDGREVQILSIHCYKLPVSSASCGQSCSVEVKFGELATRWLEKTEIRKGMVLIEASKKPRATFEFLAELTPLNKQEKNISLPPFYEPAVTSFTFRQTCVLVANDAHRQQLNFKKDDVTGSLSPLKRPVQVQEEVKEKKQRGMSSCNMELMSYSLKLSKTRSKSYRSSNEIGELSDSSVAIKEKRKKYPQSCMIDGILQKRNIQVSRPLLNHSLLDYRTNNVIRLRFKYHPEYLQVGYKILINDDKVKAIGKVIEVNTL